MNNISSKKLVSVLAEENIDSLNSQELSLFDVIVVSGYKYRSKGTAFGRLSEYVSQGGKVLIDTGGEVPENGGVNLPEFFPFSQNVRSGIGREWDIKTSQDEVFRNIAFDKFSPPLYEDADWKFSYPSDNVNPKAEVLLSNHGKPLLVRSSLGSGTVIWSGMNLSYHIHSYTNFEESKLYLNLINSFVELKDYEVVKGVTNFKSDRSLEFNSRNGGRGLLLKEMFWDGWSVKINGRRVKAYKAGPAYPGFVYVPLDGISENIVARFDYFGTTRQFLIWAIQLAVTAILIDLILFKGMIIAKRLLKLGEGAMEYVSGWWEKEVD